MPFVFYDTETTGIDRTFDQILQFAAISTDDDLIETGRIEMRCRLLPHVLPSPMALLVTKTDPATLHDPGLPSHYEMIVTVHAWLAACGPSVFTGWNTLDFDEHMIRQAFYQTLHAPYLTSVGGNRRMDMLRIAQAASEETPDALVVPLAATGRPTFRLEALAPANGLPHLNAHDALADVEATIHVARLLRERSPELWRQGLRLSSKTGVEAFVRQNRVFVAREHMFGRPQIRRLAAIGSDAGAILAYDLDVDPAELSGLDPEALAERLARSPRPVRRLRANAAPVLLPRHVDDTLSAIAADAVLSDRRLVERLVEASRQSPRAEAREVEQRIHARFAGPDDLRRMRDFHRADDWSERAQLGRSFDDPRYRALAQRLVHEHAPEVLDEASRVAARRGILARIDARGEQPWPTLARMVAQVDEIARDCPPERRQALRAVARYVSSRSRDASSAADALDGLGRAA